MRREFAARGGIAALSLVLLWRIFEVNAVLFEEDGRARLATSGDATLALLREDPAEVAALLVLARERENGADAARAASLYDAALRLAPLDRDVLEASAAFALRAGRMDKAITLLGRLVEHYDESWARAFPVLAASLVSGRESVAWQKLLSGDPPWLGAFVIDSCGRGVDPAALAPLVARRAAQGQAAPAESACLVDRLRVANRWPQAYQVWLNSLPRERLADVGMLFNGGFEYTPSNSGFDWIADLRGEREAGYVVERVAVKGGTALRVSYNGRRQTGTPIAQYLALSPGSYQFSGSGRSEGLRIGRGVQWTVRCVSDGAARTIIATSERFVGSSEWRPFSFDIGVMAQCAGQVLQLELAGADEGAAFASGAVWFDDLQIRRRPR